MMNIVLMWWYGLFTVPELWLQDLLNDLAVTEVRFIVVWAISKKIIENIRQDWLKYSATYLSAA